ncbi:hypothetical protein [Paenibacillus typhae]|uniref:hypothetical protein n=1 Tax=Paenibacillus typhae TaxID=1174501 RepID=UPI0021ADADEB|nr:hypothetical protein [Paenibacillus typhae]
MAKVPDWLMMVLRLWGVAGLGPYAVKRLFKEKVGREQLAIMLPTGLMTELLARSTGWIVKQL